MASAGEGGDVEIRLDRYQRFRSSITLRQLRTLARLGLVDYAALLSAESGIPFSAGMYEQWECGAFEPPPSVRRTAERLAFDPGVEELAGAGRAEPTGGPAGRIDQENWADDLQRSAEHLDRQHFDRATALVARWLVLLPEDGLSDDEMYLRSRSLTLLGGALRDQGKLAGPESAPSHYRLALQIAHHLNIPQRVAQLELYLTVVVEMRGRLPTAIRRYRALASDTRLSDRDRTRARLWVGTALSKHGEHDQAVREMVKAAAEFERLEEVDDWSIAHQKLALAYRGVGRIDQAGRHIEIAGGTQEDRSPLQLVRLQTAQGHILASDPLSRDEGLARLTASRELAARHGLSHQLRSIQTIHSQIERTIHTETA